MHNNSAGIPRFTGYTGPRAQEYNLGVLLSVALRVSHTIHQASELLQASNKPVHIHRLLNIVLNVELWFRSPRVLEK